MMGIRPRVALLALAAASVLPGVPTAHAAGTVTISGTVTDGSGHGWPLYSSVKIDSPSFQQTSTDPVTGHYSLTVPVNATYSLVVDALWGRYQTGIDRQVAVGQQDVHHDVTLHADTAHCDVSGYALRDPQGPVETFDATSAPAGWTVTNAADTPGWSFDNPGKRSNSTGGTGNFAIVDSDNAGAGKRQDTSLVSRRYDLSAVKDPEIRFDTTYYDSNSVADVDLSVDDGASWTTVWHQTGANARGVVAIPVPQAAGHSSVRTRFHYTGEAGWWWQVDDVYVGAARCAPVPGGLVAGTVTDANTGQVLGGARVALGSATTTTGSGSGVYVLFAPRTGPQQLTATMAKYQSTTVTVDVAADQTRAARVALPAGRLALSSRPIDATMTIGRSRRTEVTISNSGALAATATLGARYGGPAAALSPAASATARPGSGGSSARKAVPQATGRRSVTAKRDVAVRMGPAGPIGPAATGGTGSWTGLPLPPGLGGLGVMDQAMARDDDGRIFSVGGLIPAPGEQAKPTRNGYVYDPGARKWSAIAPLPAPLQQPAAAFVHGRLYVAGGFVPTSSTAERKLYIYDPATNTWSTGTDLPAGRGAAGTAVMNGRIYLVGGCTDADCNVAADVLVYDPGADAWQSVAAYPTAVGYTACGGIAGKLYCAGGVNSFGNGIADTYVYDPGADTWSPVAPLPETRWGPSYAIGSGRLLLTGGVVSGSATRSGVVYDPVAGTWSSLPDFPSAYPIYRGAAVCGFYRLGGMTTPYGFAANDFLQLSGYDQCGPVDVPGWLAVSPAQIHVPAHGSVTVTVTMTGAAIDQPGTNTGRIVMDTADTPYSPAPLPVTMRAQPPETWGAIAGTVTGPHGCDTTLTPVDRATVQVVTRTGTHTIRTDAKGHYTLWMDVRENPLTVIVAKDGYRLESKRARIVRTRTATINLALATLKSCS